MSDLATSDLLIIYIIKFLNNVSFFMGIPCTIMTLYNIIVQSNNRILINHISKKSGLTRFLAFVPVLIVTLSDRYGIYTILCWSWMLAT